VMWTTRYWYDCMARMEAYERRVRIKHQAVGAQGRHKIEEEGDMENTGIERYISSAVAHLHTTRTLWFVFNHD
jgi:hypothetical protein